MAETTTTHKKKNKKMSTEDMAKLMMTWCAYGCCFLVVVIFLVFAIMVPIYLSRTDRFEHDMDHRMRELQLNNDETASSSAESKESFFSLMSVMTSNKKKVYPLCYLNVFYSKNGTSKDPLYPLTETIAEILEGDMKNYYYYQLNIKLRLTFNVDASSILGGGTVKTNPRLKFIDVSRKYMTIDYNITSNFGYFSTIKLEELEFNVDEQSIKPITNSILCTNNPNIATTSMRCDKLISNNILALHRSELTPVFNSLMDEEEIVKKKHMTTTTSLNIKNDEEMLFYDQLKSNILGVRLYNIVFYQQEYTDNNNPYDTNNNDDNIPDRIRKNRTAPPVLHSRLNNKHYRERKVLTIQPRKC